MYITPFFSLLGRSLIYLISVLVQWLHHWRISKKLSKKYYPFLFSISSVILLHSNLNSPELQKSYFLYNHKQFCSKVPIIFYFVRPKHPSGNCYVSCFLTEKTPFTPLHILLRKTLVFTISNQKNFFLAKWTRPTRPNSTRIWTLGASPIQPEFGPWRSNSTWNLVY